jgi:hypothetical protein
MMLFPDSARGDPLGLSKTLQAAFQRRNLGICWGKWL